MKTNESLGKLEKIKENLKISESDNMDKAQELLDDFFWQLGECNFDKITGGRYSFNFIVGLFSLSVQGVEIGRIIDEIKHLEDPVNNNSYTKPATQFSHLPLKGLWHKHFLPGDVSSIAKNILSGLNAKGGLRKVIENVCMESGEKTFSKDLVRKLVNEVTEVPFSERGDQGLITGEWIIYHQYEGKNYYLAIATHDGGMDESGNSGDQVIAKNIQVFSKIEFPQLKGTLDIFS